MDVLNTLKTNMGHIVTEIFTKCNDQEEFLNEMYKLIEYDIDINFDSLYFYLLDYKQIENNKIYFDITNPHTPRQLLIMIRNLITHNRMKENIKNKNFRIHFRDFVDEVKLENKENTLRIEAFMQMHRLCKNPITIRIFLINKHNELIHKIKKTDDMNDIIQYKIHKFRIEQILKTIEMYTIQEY